MADWLDKPYYSLDAYCKETFHHKCYKIALNAHMTCPNRDGTLDTRGCIFCSKGGSGEFAAPLFSSDAPASSHQSRVQADTGRQDAALLDLTPQLRRGMTLFGGKKVGEHFIAYFQAYTNTYAPLPYLEKVYRSALILPDICGISIATRPDCIHPDVCDLLRRLRGEYPDKFIWIELGLQTIHESTARYIRRGYELPCFERAMQELRKSGIPTIVHLILGLPGESVAMQLESVDYISQIKPFGVKFQLLHVLEGTDLALDYRNGLFKVLSKESYLSLLSECLAHLHPDIVVHRVTGDGSSDQLIAPLWSKNKRDVLNSLHRFMKETGVRQGIHLMPPPVVKEEYHGAGSPDPV